MRHISTESGARTPLWKRALLVVAVAFGLLALYLLFWPVPIHPYAWQPGPDPGQTGPYVPNSDLKTARVVGLTRYQGPKDLAIVYQGPEDLAIGPEDGLFYTGVTTGAEDGPGAIISIDPETDVVKHYVDTGGRPLGLAFIVNQFCYFRMSSNRF